MTNEKLNYSLNIKYKNIINKVLNCRKILLATIDYRCMGFLESLRNRRDTYILDLGNIPKGSMKREEYFVYEILYKIFTNIIIRCSFTFKLLWKTGIFSLVLSCSSF